MKVFYSKTFWSAVVVSALLSPAVIASQTSTPSNAPAPQPQMGSAIEVEDSQIREFVKVETKLETINAKYSKELSGATDAETVQKTQAKAQEEAMNVIESSAISLQEFQMIAQAIQTQPDVQERYQRIRR